MGALVTICPQTGRRIRNRHRYRPDQHGDDAAISRPNSTARIAASKHLVGKQDFYVCEMVDGVVRYLPRGVTFPSYRQSASTRATCSASRPVPSWI